MEREFPFQLISNAFFPEPHHSQKCFLNNLATSCTLKKKKKKILQAPLFHESCFPCVSVRENISKARFAPSHSQAPSSHPHRPGAGTIREWGRCSCFFLFWTVASTASPSSIDPPRDSSLDCTDPEPKRKFSLCFAFMKDKSSFLNDTKAQLSSNGLRSDAAADQTFA